MTPPKPNSLVLIVEDEEESRETLRELLELEGYRVDTAVNGREALAKLAALPEPPCIMLLDLFMPEMDGWEVIEQLRSDGRLSRIQVVIITSAAHRAPAGVPVFEKPLDVDKVIRTVEALC